MFTPERIVIDGTRHKVLSTQHSVGNRHYYEVRIGKKETIILLPFRLFYVFGSLALLRDAGQLGAPQGDVEQGFVHRDQLQLEKSTMNQYIYCTRLEIYKQVRSNARDNQISIAECYDLMNWPVIENGLIFGQESRWRLVIEPAAVSVSACADDFPDAVFNKIYRDWHARHSPRRFS